MARACKAFWMRLFAILPSTSNAFKGMGPSYQVKTDIHLVHLSSLVFSSELHLFEACLNLVILGFTEATH